MHKVFIQFNYDPSYYEAASLSAGLSTGLHSGRLISMDLEYETSKDISTKIQSAFGISANIHKRTQFS